MGRNIVWLHQWGCFTEEAFLPRNSNTLSHDSDAASSSRSAERQSGREQLRRALSSDLKHKTDAIPCTCKCVHHSQVRLLHLIFAVSWVQCFFQFWAQRILRQRMKVLLSVLFRHSLCLVPMISARKCVRKTEKMSSYYADQSPARTLKRWNWRLWANVARWW